MVRDELKEGEVLEDGTYPALCNQNYHPICLRSDCYGLDVRQIDEFRSLVEVQEQFLLDSWPHHYLLFQPYSHISDYRLYSEEIDTSERSSQNEDQW